MITIISSLICLFVISHQAQSHGTLTFHQLEDLIKAWSLETEELEKIFHNMIKDIFQIDRHIEANQKKVSITWYQINL